MLASGGVAPAAEEKASPMMPERNEKRTKTESAKLTQLVPESAMARLQVLLKSAGTENMLISAVNVLAVNVLAVSVLAVPLYLRLF